MKEKDALQLQLSAARIQLSYNREMGLNNGVEKVLIISLFYQVASNRKSDHFLIFEGSGSK